MLTTQTPTEDTFAHALQERTPLIMLRTDTAVTLRRAMQQLYVNGALCPSDIKAFTPLFNLLCRKTSLAEAAQYHEVILPEADTRAILRLMEEGFARNAFADRDAVERACNAVERELQIRLPQFLGCVGVLAMIITIGAYVGLMF